MNIEDVINEVITILTEAIEPPTATILPMPDNIDSYVMKHPRAEILVLYTYARPDETTLVQQSVKIDTEIQVWAKTLYGTTGLYGLLTKVRSELTSRFTSWGGRLTWIEETFIEKDGGIWKYGQRYETTDIFITGD